MKKKIKKSWNFFAQTLALGQSFQNYFHMAPFKEIKKAMALFNMISKYDFSKK